MVGRAAGLGLVLLLGGCDSPSIGFMAAEATTVEIDGTVFDIRTVGTDVEVIRTNFETMPALGDIQAKAVQAILIATGCAVAEGRLTGDVSIMRARLDCA